MKHTDAFNQNAKACRDDLARGPAGGLFERIARGMEAERLREERSEQLTQASQHRQQIQELHNQYMRYGRE